MTSACSELVEVLNVVCGFSGITVESDGLWTAVLLLPEINVTGAVLRTEAIEVSVIGIIFRAAVEVEAVTAVTGIEGVIELGSTAFLATTGGIIPLLIQSSRCNRIRSAKELL